MSGRDAGPGQMPERLREILSEPGWRIDTFLWGTRYARCPVMTVYFDRDWNVMDATLDKPCSVKHLRDAADRLERIEQALAGSGGAAE